ncbi:hypothetical protein PFMALIP_02281 [Plasmodium falciparum MaliPS096_E11]|uniref:Uncharacterized protein n=1 Tax=Plasmodium falciparum MaliPS096_E11 TaxID=1036727 RepID=A0A024WRD1_PLAFA|nr:hypothetical protein PFMALIP_02281 [Plasmodium falciparum MaliPS096_E11]
MLLKCINLCKNNFEFNCFVEYTEIYGYINNYYINHINVKLDSIDIFELFIKIEYYMYYIYWGLITNDV